MPISEVYNEDCMIGMARFSDKFFDLAIVDPPYGIGAAKEKPHNGWKDWGIKEWDNTSPTDSYFNELFRVSNNQIIWGANHFISNMAINSQGWIVWDKGQRDFSLADGELAWTSFDRSLKIFDYARALANNQHRIHPTQKPIALYKWLLRNYAKSGDKILDTHLGSQSSRIAAWDGGFDFWGWELDPDYFRDGCKRFDNHIKQLTLNL